MYEVREGLQMVNGEIIQTFERDVNCGSGVISVEAGTTGPCKGGRDAGARILLRLTNLDGADFYARFSEVDEGYTKEVLIALSGDAEIDGFIDSLIFALQTYMDQYEDGLTRLRKESSHMQKRNARSCICHSGRE